MIECSINICGYRLGTLGIPVFEHFRRYPIKGREGNCGNMQKVPWCSAFLTDPRETPFVLREGLPGMSLLGRRQSFTFWIRWPQSHLIYGAVTAIWCQIKCILKKFIWWASSALKSLSQLCRSGANIVILAFIYSNGAGAWGRSGTHWASRLVREK